VGVNPWLLEGWAQDALLPKHPEDKKPGRWLEREKRWVGLQGHILKQGLPGAKDPTAWQDVQAWPWEGLCVRGTYYPGLDIDCEHQVAVHAVLKAAEAFAGQSLPVRGRASSQRLLAPFEAITPGSIGPWRPVRFKMPNGMTGMVELKAHGTQWVAAGRHPDGQDYKWLPDEIPDAVCGLPSLRDQEHADALRDAVVDALERAGAELLPTGPGGGSSGSGAGYRDPDDHEALVPLEALEAALAATPCTPEMMPDHDTAVRVMAGLRWILGSEGASIPDFVMEWLLSYPGAGDEWISQRWDSFYSIAPSGAAFLDALARHCGDRGAYRAVQAAVDGGKARDIFDDGDVDGDDLDSVRTVSGQADEDQGQAPPDDGNPLGRDGGPSKRLQEIRQQVAYLWPVEEWIIVPLGERLSENAFNKSPLGREITRLDFALQQGDNPRPRSASKVLLDGQHGDLDIDRYTYAPGRKRFFRQRDEQGRERKFINSWAGLELPERRVTDDEVRPFLRVLAHVFRLKEDETLFLDWAGFIARNPGVKVNWAPVLFSQTQGVGKDTVLLVVKHGVVGAHNFAAISPARLESEFNADWAPKQIVLVTELSSYHRRDLYDKLKDHVSGGAGDISVNPKGLARYAIPNTHCWVFTTNKIDALQFEDGDRRFAIINAREEAMPDDIRREFYAWAKSGGWELAGAWIAQREISAGFDADKCPQASEAKLMMAEEAVSRDAQDMAEFLTDGPYATRTIVTMGEVRLAAMPAERVRNADVRKALQVAGFVLPAAHDGRNRINVGKVKMEVWVRAEKDGLKSSSHARLAEILLREQEESSSPRVEVTRKAVEDARPKLVGVD
jgi:hypothetical protein